jgi:hypothetical protein
MAASDETPAPKGDVGSAKGTFTGTLTKSDTGAVLTWQLSFTGLTGPAVAAHIHIAARGTPGPVVVPLCAPCTSGVTGTANITPVVLEAIENDRAYVNVHTKTNPAGEIRDQVSPVATLRASLRAAQERPKPKGNVRRARGAFIVSIAKQGSSAVLTWRLTFSRLTGKAVAAHIHRGVRGKAGPVIVPLCAPCKSGVQGKATVDSSVLNALEEEPGRRDTRPARVRSAHDRVAKAREARPAWAGSPFLIRESVRRRRRFDADARRRRSV